MRDRRRPTPEVRAPELLIEAPISLGMMLDAADDLPSQVLLEVADAALTAGRYAAIDALQREAGRTGIAGRYQPCTLHTRTTFHRYAAGHRDVSRPHEHLRVEHEALAEDGRRYPVHAELIRQAAPLVQVHYTTALRSALRDAGVETVGMPGTPWSWHVATVAEAAAGLERRECPPDGMPAALQVVPTDAQDREHLARKLA